jgi:hypothetical protein
LKEVALIPEMDLPAFVDACSVVFWACLEKPLEDVRKLLQEQVRAEVIDLFGKLSRKVSTVLTSEQSMHMSHKIIEAQTEVQVVLQRISAWFLLPEKETASVTYTIEQAIDIAVEFTKNARRGFRPSLTREIAIQSNIDGEMLGRLTDCIFIMLDNVWRHSGVRDEPAVTLAVYYDDARQELVVKMISDALDSARSPATQQRLDKIRVIMDTGQYMEVLRSEGGSGLLKLRRLAGTQETNAVAFGFNDQGSFEVQVRIRAAFAKTKQAVSVS